MMASGKHSDIASSQSSSNLYMIKTDSCVGNEDMGIKLWLTSSISCMNVLVVKDLAGRCGSINEIFNFTSSFCYNQMQVCVFL